ncbi:MAG: Hpt domain-containing protein, partial [Bacteroidota bacterium]|nr:Hpt domain-containing protein [Bacteroidota bacterium]MDX5429554.1 Hpt domain-containing protein [Bacteroidota bacterium]MDX5468341.1 Hpt domain-containing protein [Bacteroidota bacterium]
YEEFIRQTAGDKDIAFQVAQIYNRDINSELEGLKSAFDQKDFEAVRRRAHKFKSGFIVMGAKSLFEQAYSLESRSKNGESDLGDAIQTFTTECLELKDELIHQFGQ